MIDPGDIASLPGIPVLDLDGESVGTLGIPYGEPGTGRPLWASVHRSGMADVFVPLDGATREDADRGPLSLPVTLAAIESAPVISSRITFTDDHAALLHEHYAHAATATEPGVAADNGSPSILRSEEQLRILTETVPAERVRLRKVVVTEQKTISVTVRREEFQLIQEPLDPNTPVEPSSSVNGSGLDLVLHEEQVVVTKRVVPVERIHVDVIRVAGTVPVTADLRKERITIDTTP